jgi:hypothetical protein
MMNDECLVLEIDRWTGLIEWICTLYFPLFFSDGNKESSGFQWNPESTVFLFCGGEQEKSSGFRNPLEYGRFQWIPVDSSGFQWIPVESD